MSIQPSYFGPEDPRKNMYMREPVYYTYYTGILQNKPYSLDDIIGYINDGKITKEIVEQLRQKRDTDGPGKRFFNNFNALVDMLYNASENDASKRSILESVGFLDDFINNGPRLKGGIRRRRKGSKRRRSSRRKGGSRKRKGCSRRK